MRGGREAVRWKVERCEKVEEDAADDIGETIRI
jgi:hypothetical protein